MAAAGKSFYTEKNGKAAEAAAAAAVVLAAQLPKQGLWGDIKQRFPLLERGGDETKTDLGQHLWSSEGW